MITCLVCGATATRHFTPSVEYEGVRYYGKPEPFCDKHDESYCATIAHVGGGNCVAVDFLTPDPDELEAIEQEKAIQ